MKLKVLAYRFAKCFGLFFVAKLFTSSGARILCYHGFSCNDEHLFRPTLFITAALFERRLEKISQMGFKVITLDDLVKQIKCGAIVTNTLVITIDDGLQGVDDIAAPLLSRYGFDWTLYLTTYYVEKQTQVMNLAIQYLCWKTNKEVLNLSELGDYVKEPVILRTGRDVDMLASMLIEQGERIKCAQKRQEFIRQIAAILGVNQAEIELRRMFHLIDADTVSKLHNKNVQIELHTHRHRPVSELNTAGLEKEVRDNQASIFNICNYRPVHFCYPSGLFMPHQTSWFDKLEVVSATTCVPGLNYKDGSLFAMNRFVDGENIPEIVFEAELCGFADLLRRLKYKFGFLSRRNDCIKPALH